MALLRVVVDTREKGSQVPSHLQKLGVALEYRLLDIGDYIVGEWAIERKKDHDFVSSLFSGRLFDQARRLAAAYRSVIILIEGDLQATVGTLRNPRVYWGTLISLSLRFGIKIFLTFNEEQTAQFIYTLARRMGKKRRPIPPLLVKKPRRETLADWQLAVVESLPGIGPKLADQLLQAFGSVRRVFICSTTDLGTRGGIGRARALRVSHLLDAKYQTQEAGGQTLLAE